MSGFLYAKLKGSATAERDKIKKCGKIKKYRGKVKRFKAKLKGIRAKCNCIALGYYLDEGISGTSLKKRDEFNEMISRCINGEFNLIVTKSVSRFARNLVDCISLVRKLKNLTYPVGVFFETDNLFTLSEDSELKLSLLATFAQEESIKKSESMNWSLSERFKNKKLLTPELFGYRRPRDAAGNYVKYGKLEIEENEAEIVRFIYNAFLSGFSVESICDILESMKCKTKLGNTQWNKNSVLYILRNERYCGNVLTWKQFTADIFEHKKRKNRQDRDQYLYTNVHEAIIPMEKFEAVQVLIENRKHGYRNAIPRMQVIDMGVFCGYVPVNHHWINDVPETYYTASDNAAVHKKSKKLQKSYFSKFNLTGYQVVRCQFLTARSEFPAITFNKSKITFNRFCIKKLDSAEYIQLLLHPSERKIAIRPCSKDDIFSIPWQKNTGRIASAKTIVCVHFCSALYQIMEWFPDYSYKAMGTLIKRGREEIVIFNLSGAAPYITVKNYAESSEKSKPTVKRIDICPEEWDDSFGNEFYDFSMENKEYYSSENTDLKMYEKCRPVIIDDSVKIMNKSEILQLAENLKKKAGEKDE